MSCSDPELSSYTWLVILQQLLEGMRLPYRTPRQRRHIQVTVRRLQHQCVFDFGYHFICSYGHPRRWYSEVLMLDLDYLSSNRLTVQRQVRIRPDVVKRLQRWQRACQRRKRRSNTMS